MPGEKERKQSRHVALQNCCTRRECRNGTDQYFFNVSHFGKYLPTFFLPLPHFPSLSLSDDDEWWWQYWMIANSFYIHIYHTDERVHTHILRQTHRHRGRRTHARTRSHHLLSSLPVRFQTRLVRMLTQSHGRLHSAFCLSCLLSSFTKSFSVAPRCYHFHLCACLR